MDMSRILHVEVLCFIISKVVKQLRIIVLRKK